MLRRDYNNFVRPASTAGTVRVFNTISGDEARRLYLEEVDQVKEKDDLFVPDEFKTYKVTPTKRNRTNSDNLDVSNLKLFTSVQDNDVETLKRILDTCPDKIKTVDEYGWSLLMIACQANTYATAKELLKRGVDTTVRDKAGNSAQSLIIRNKNSRLAEIFLNHVSKCSQSQNHNSQSNDGQRQLQNISIKEAKHKTRHKEPFVCHTCGGKTFNSKEEHLSSTIHNINASKGRKIPTKYVIPQSNKGYQIMLKTGWDRETGLGPDGSGTKYPIKAIQKIDKKGLGHEKKKLKIANDKLDALKINQHSENVSERNRRLEINFRREFY